MRKTLYVILLAVVCLACQPHVKYLNANTTNAGAGPAKITLNWRISNGGGEMSADTDVTPSLKPPKPVNQEGSLDETICKTTTFKLSLPYGGERTVTVNVAQPCICAQQVLTFNGMCQTASQPPDYDKQHATSLGIIQD